DGFTGLTAGAPIYAGDTAGGITQTRPTPTLDGVQVVVAILGVAISATEIYVRSRSVEYLKRVALDNEETVTITHHTDPAGRLRETWAYVSQSSGVSAIIEYASGNQDNDYALRNQIVATYGADQTTGGTASASTSIASPSAAFADDGNGVSNSWVSAVVATAWLKYDFGVGVTRTIRRYTIIEQASFAARAPQDWTFEGSNDDSNWDVLDTVTGETGWSGIRTFDFVNDTGYRYYRINISENNGDAYISIGEMQMQEAATFTTSADELAQTITLASEATVASVSLYLRKVGSPTGTLTCTIETLCSGNPSGTVVDANATVTVAESSLGTSYAMVEFDFTDFTLPTGSYAIVLNTDRAIADSAGDYIEWGYDASSSSYISCIRELWTCILACPFTLCLIALCGIVPEQRRIILDKCFNID
ncbi:MAG: discoidin domain-containing protein, partial [Chloroflexota bacterium]